MNRKLQEMEDRTGSRVAVKESYFEEGYNKCERRLFNNVENSISNIQTALKKADTQKSNYNSYSYMSYTVRDFF